MALWQPIQMIGELHGKHGATPSQAVQFHVEGREGSMSSRLLTVDEVAQMLGVKRQTITAYKARRQMPEPDKVYGRTPLWKESTIMAWRGSQRSSQV